MVERVSIIMATRNRARLLASALASLRRQTHRDLEICVLDDASTDDTPILLDRLATTDRRIRWWRREAPQGLASALNFLIDKASGAFLARMDDDDLAYPERMASQLAFMQSEHVDVCGTWYRRVAGWRRSVARPAVGHEAICAELLFQPPLLHPSVMMRRSVVERCGGYPEDAPHAEDYALWVKLLPDARFGNCPRVLMDYRLSAQQVSRAHHPEQLRNARALRSKALDRLGILCDKRQRELHSHLRDPEPIVELGHLHQIYAWLEVLSRQLPAAGQKAVARQAFLQTVRAAGLGLPVFDAFRQSRWGEQVNRKSTALLWGLCALRLRYQSPLYKRLEPLASIG
jgi:glycosyltransferase involved in cell wall biosynthesis